LAFEVYLDQRKISAIEVDDGKGRVVVLRVAKCNKGLGEKSEQKQPTKKDAPKALLESKPVRRSSHHFFVQSAKKSAALRTF